jgi:hypothetical protein
MDAKYPKLIDKQQSIIINQQIPMEILSYIISIRVCKSMSAMVLYDRYKINPTINELEIVQWYYNKSDCVHYMYNEVTKENIYICNTLRDGGYMLINKEGRFKGLNTRRFESYRKSITCYTINTNCTRERSVV